MRGHCKGKGQTMAKLNEQKCSICSEPYLRSKLGHHIRSTHKGMDQCCECGDGIPRSQLQFCQHDKHCRYLLCGNPNRTTDSVHALCTQARHAVWCKEHGIQKFKRALKSFSLQSREVRTHKDGPEALKVAAYQLKNAENAL